MSEQLLTEQQEEALRVELMRSAYRIGYIEGYQDGRQPAGDGWRLGEAVAAFTARVRPHE